MIFKKLSFWLALVGMVATIRLVLHLRKVEPIPAPVTAPAMSPYSKSVAATGIVEAAQENVKIATSKAGLVVEIPVKVASEVKKGDVLLRLDDREIKARWRTRESEMKSLKGQLETEKVALADAQDQMDRIKKLRDQEAATEDEWKRKVFQVDAVKSRLQKVELDIQSAESAMKQDEEELSLLTVKAPRDGSILQLNVRVGEYAALNPVEPLMVLGETRRLQIRADVDEQNAPLVIPGKSAVAFLKGRTTDPIPLKFSRVEPFVVPKKSLTGESTERVDTRVLQVIFEFDRPSLPIYVGQQVDVFIDRE